MARRPSLSHAHVHARTHTHTHAIYVHCGPHCVNLVTQAACSTTPIVRDALQWTHELGCLFGQSGKFKTIFKSVAKSTSGSYITLKPLCPTRWTVRTPAIDAILGQYEAVLAALEEMASSNTSDTASRANGLHERFQKGTTVLGLFLAKEVMMGLEGLNTSLQGRGKTVGGMLSAVDCVKKTLSEPTNRRSIHHSLHQCNWSCYIFGHRTNKDATFTKATEETCWPSWALCSIHRSGVLPCTVLPSPWHCNNIADKAVWTGRATAPGQAGESPTLWSSWWRGWPVSRAAVPVPKGGAGHVHCQLHLPNLLISDRSHKKRGSRGPWSLQSSWGASAFVARCSCLICWSREKLQCLETPEDLAALFNVTNPTQQCGCLSCSQRENV